MAVYTVTPQDQYDIAGLYAAFWNRAPDTTGFGFWVEKLASGVSLDEIATAFRNAPEGVAEYPLWSTNVELVTEVYANVFGRAPDTQGLLFWTGKLDSGQVTFPELVVDMCEAAMTNGSADGALFENKVEVGVYVATVAQTDNGYVCDNAFNQVTADPASVATAEAWVDANNTGATYTLTTNIDTINVDGHAVNTVSGNIGANQTYNSGDTVNGNGLTKVALVVDGVNADPAAPVVDLNNIASVNVNLVSSGATIDETEFSNVAAVTVTNGVSGSSITASNAAQSTVHGLAVAGRSFTETITYAAPLTGTADVAALSLAGTGVKATDGSTLNVANSNAIEVVTVATSGKNFATINGGTGAATFTVTGNGVNDLTIGSSATTAKFDLSATTAANTLRLGTQLTANDTVLGGSAVDTLVATTAAGQLTSTITGVENLTLTAAGNTVFNAKNVTGLEHISIAGAAGTIAPSFTNLNASVDAINLGTTAAISNTGGISFSYSKGSDSDVAVTLGATPTTAGTTAAVTVGTLTFANNAGALAFDTNGTDISTIGAAALAATAVDADDVSALAIAATAQDLDILNSDAAAATIVANSAQSVVVDATANDIRIVNANADNDAIDASEALQTVTITSGAGAATVDDINVVATLTTDDINTTFNLIGGKSVITTGALNTTAIASFKGQVNSVVNATATKGTVTIGDIVINELLSNDTSSLEVNLTSAGGAVVVTDLSLDDVDTSTLTLAAVAATDSVTIHTLSNAVATAGVLDAITVSGAGSVTVGDVNSGAVAGDTVVDALAQTGALDLRLGSATGDLTVSLGNAATGLTNRVDTGDGADIVYGGTGKDNISTGDNVDVVYAGAGNDTIDGGDGVDTLYGDNGNDSIVGGVGADNLYGGAGNDTFAYTAVAEFATGEVVDGGTGTNAFAFAAGSVSYVGRTVSNVQSLTFAAADNANALVITQGTGLVTVDNLEGTSAGTNLGTINYATTVFQAQAEADAAAVTEAGEWYAAVGGDDTVITYWDQVAGSAVALTFVGVNSGSHLDSAVAVSNDNLVLTVTYS